MKEKIKKENQGNQGLDELCKKIANMEDILAAIGDAISIQDTDFRIIYQNEAHKNLIGDHAGGYCYRAYNRRDIICEGCPVVKSFTDGGIHTIEKTGGGDNKFIVEITASSLRDSSGKIIAGIEVVRDITRRRKADEALRKSEEQYRILLENIQDGVFVVLHGKLKFVNDSLAKMAGYTADEITGREFQAFIAPEDVERLSEYYAKRQEGRSAPREYECRLLHKDGISRILVKVNVGTILYEDGIASLGTVKDITGNRKIEEELQKTQKMEILGGLAGGIAHEFNNILTAIVGNIALAKMYAKPGLEIFDILTEVEMASLKAKNLTQQLNTFSKGGNPVKRIFSLADLIRDSVNFALSGSTIRCEFLVQDDLLPVEGDENQINQALNNLIVNAKDAMPQGGIVQVKAENIMLYPENPFNLGDGKYIKISVMDHGVGIPKEYLPKVFDPFFTTKKDRDGLGLTITYSIVKKHNGYIGVDSKPGEGAAFYLYLPAVQEKITPKEKTGQRFPTGRGKILVMEDEDLVRSVIARMLDQCGYQAEFAKDGIETIELYMNAKNSAKPFDAVIMDLIIPGGMGGRETIRKLIELDPDVKAIVSSGYSNDQIMSNFREYGFTSILPKPYSLEDLCRTLYKVTKGQD